jgi:hypothetical protein
MADILDVFQIDQNYPTANALLVPGPNQSSYTVFVYNYSDWSLGNQSTLYAIAQSQVNSDGTWVGVFDPIDQSYSKVMLARLAIDGSIISPYTVVAINSTTTIILALQLFPAVTPTAFGQWLFNDPVQSGQLLSAGF